MMGIVTCLTTVKLLGNLALTIKQLDSDVEGKLDRIKSKLDELPQSELNSGRRFLKMAENSSLSQTEVLELVKDARRCLTKAVDFEEKGSERWAVAWMCLGVCHYILGDKNNFEFAKQKLEQCTKEFEKKLQQCKETAAIGFRLFGPLLNTAGLSSLVGTAAGLVVLTSMFAKEPPDWIKSFRYISIVKKCCEHLKTLN